MNGYSILFMAVLIVALAVAAGVLSWGLIRGVSTFSHHPFHRRGHRG